MIYSERHIRRPAIPCFWLAARERSGRGLRGQERATDYARQADGSFAAGGSSVLLPGQVTAVSPRIGDVHEVANDLADQASISIHVYGGNIGRIDRHVFDPASGAAKSFVSGYASALVPNLWS